MHALIKDGVVAKYPYSVTDARRDNPNVSFPSSPSDEAMADFGVMRVFFSPQPETNADQVLVEGTPVFSEADQRWTQVWTVRDKTTKEIETEAAIKSAEIRSERNRLLAESDWTQLADSSADKDVWAVYRQFLRDITTQEGFPWEVIWPEKPQ